MENNIFGYRDYIKMFKKYGLKLPINYFFENHFFDIINNVDTHKRVLKSQYQSSPNNFDDGVFYMASFNSVIKTTISKIHSLEKDNFAEFNLIDVGSGKGKVLFIWRKYLKKQKLKNKITGIEYDQNLGLIAKNNLQNDPDIEILIKDIENTPDYIFENDAIYYLYNPFGKRVLRRFIDKIEGNNYVIYNNPVHLSFFLNNNFEVISENIGFHPNLDWVILKKKYQI